MILKSVNHILLLKRVGELPENTQIFALIQGVNCRPKKQNPYVAPGVIAPLDTRRVLIVDALDQVILHSKGIVQTMTIVHSESGNRSYWDDVKHLIVSGVEHLIIVSYFETEIVKAQRSSSEQFRIVFTLRAQPSMLNKK